MKTLLIANRGEIARRVLRSGRERGYRVAVISTLADRDSLVRSEADEVCEVGSFLDGEAIVSAATACGASVLHPGYGFLSENAPFARAIESAGIAFCGPTPEAMEALGNKESAKRLAAECDVPTLASVPASEIDKLEDAGIEPPYLVKAAGGGGGRGMRVVPERAELLPALARASEEAAAGFGDPTVFVERYLPNPRHIEIQVMGDGEGGGVAIGERECSLQRRFQKVIEEAPSAAVSGPLRSEMEEAAMALVRRTRYRGAGTVEFLLDADGNFYFLEVNTRLQVEHPVTEAVYDVDLVSAQLDIAEGTWPQELEHLSRKRWAIEARVLAEDPRREFLPTPGPLLRYREPSLESVRVDSGVSEGGRVDAGFDSMIAKVIAVGDTRAEAAARLSLALEATIIHGTATNVAFLQAVVRHPDFLEGSFSTSWIAENLDELNRSLIPEALADRLQTPGFRERLSHALRGGETMTRAGARFGALDNRVLSVGSDRERLAVDVDASPRTGELQLRGPGVVAALTGDEAPSLARYSRALNRSIDTARREPERAAVPALATVLDSDRMALSVFGETLELSDPRALGHRRLVVASSDGEVHAPMAGKVLDVLVGKGAAVQEGQVVAVVESMKMQLEVRAPIAGAVDRVLVAPGDVLDGPNLLLVVSAT